MVEAHIYILTALVALSNIKQFALGEISVLAQTVTHSDNGNGPPAADHEATELKLVHALFRHGDRTPDREEMELNPTDPNINNTFYPYGLKALTNAGKAREYKVGLFLRNRYNGFLKDLYIPEELYVRTTDYARTKMSALACLAGLYPPNKIQQWHPKILWQPIPYYTQRYEDDDMMYYYVCPRFPEARFEVLYSPEFQKKLEPYRELFKTISYHTNRNITTPEEIFYIDNLFQAEQNYDIPPPEWAVPIMKKIKEMTVIEYELQYFTDELKRLSGGVLLQKMITDSYAKIKNTIDPSGRKIFLYSGHENNVAAMLAVSTVFKPHQPAYGSTYILELHQQIKSKAYVFRILYLRDVSKPPEILPIPNCGEFCPFERFVELTRNLVTNNFKEICREKNTPTEKIEKYFDNQHYDNPAENTT